MEYLRSIFQKLANNEDLQSELEKVSGPGEPFMSGKDLQQNFSKR